MTTIAYKDGIIAYDSRMTGGPTIIDDDYDKKTTVNGKSYYYSGNASDKKDLISLDQGANMEIKHSAAAIRVCDKEIHYIGMNKEDGLWRQSIDKNKPYAIGSGQDHAWTAMDMGATAKQSVQMAMKRDTGTGGKIRTCRVK